MTTRSSSSVLGASGAGRAGGPPRVYLAGGTHERWHDDVISALPGVSFLDPRSLAGCEMAEVVRIERDWLDASDALFACLTKANPSGLGMSFEIGYASRAGTPIVFVDEWNDSRTRWLAAHCRAHVHQIEDGIAALRELLAELQTGQT